MSGRRTSNGWLVTAGGGTIAAVAGAYLLYLLPPEWTLGGRQREAVPLSVEVTATGGSVSAPVDEASARGFSEPEQPFAVEAPAMPDEEVRDEATQDRLASQEELRPEPASLDVSRVRLLSPNAPVVFPEIDTVVSVAFRETLGSQYAEFVVDAPGGESFRFPARSGGAARQFDTGGQRYEIRVVAIDLQAKTSHVMVRRAAAS